jgi:hypothetical protein
MADSDNALGGLRRAQAEGGIAGHIRVAVDRSRVAVGHSRVAVALVAVVVVG